MESIVYVTGNNGKYNSMKKLFDENNLSLEHYNIDLEEVDVNNIELISKEKAKSAFEILQKPCFVTDSGFYIDDYPGNPGYPGAFVKRSGVSSNIDNLLLVMKDIKKRKCRFLDCLTFYDGTEFYQFYGISEGTLSYEKRGEKNIYAKSNLWYVFIPNNCNKTLAEMTDEERLNRKDFHTSASEEFVNWYIIKNKKLKKFYKKH